MSLFYVFMICSRAVYIFLSVSSPRSSYLASHCDSQNSLVQSSHCSHQHCEITTLSQILHVVTVAVDITLQQPWPQNTQAIHASISQIYAIQAFIQLYQSHSQALWRLATKTQESSNHNQLHAPPRATYMFYGQFTGLSGSQVQLIHFLHAPH